MNAGAFTAKASVESVSGKQGLQGEWQKKASDHHVPAVWVTLGLGYGALADLGAQKLLTPGGRSGAQANGR